MYKKNTIQFGFILLLFFYLNVSVAFSQNSVTGTVSSRNDGETLPGVNILIKGTNTGTSTDFDGKYSLKVNDPATDILIFSFIGFATIEIPVSGRSLIDVMLEEDIETLEEIVVIGYGTVRKSDLTGSVSSIKGKDLTKVPSLSPMQALQGKVAGVQITSASGAPGDGVIVRIRGTGTFNNANPIYVVDGVILDNIDFLNTADIASMEVLKDASATAIYGSRGANGVIMITTRQGTRGQENPTINFSAEYSQQSLLKDIDLLNGREFATIVNEINPGTYNNLDGVPNTDWQGLLFEPAPIQNYQVSAAWGAERSQYYIGLGYFKQEGIIPKSNYERVTFKLNNTYFLTEAIRLGNNISIVPYRRQNTNGNAPFVVYRAQPTIDPFQPDGSYSEVPGVGNVLADLEYTNSFGEGVRSVSNLFAEFDFLDGFTFKSSFGFDAEYNKGRSFTPVFFVSAAQSNATSDLNKSYNDRFTWLWENTLSYRKDIGKTNINAVVGYTMQESSSEGISAAGENIIRDSQDFWYLNPDNLNPNSLNNSVSLDQYYSIISYLFRANIIYDHRYLFTVTYRRDGSSKFSSENRYSDFPSFALGWNVINEPFMSGISGLSNLKVRASWGIIGNEKIAYDRQYSRVNNGVSAVFGNPGEIFPGSTYGVTGNPNLVWESTYQTDIGLELGFFEDRLTAELDYYNKTTRDILIDLPIPGYQGNGVGAMITYNAAEVLNRGFEYHITYSNEWNDIRYSIGTVGTTIHNEALKVLGTGGTGDRLLNGSQTTSTSAGLPIGAFYGYQTDGIFQNQSELDAYPHRFDAGVGDLRFVDVNNDGVLNGDDRTFIGSPIPDFLYGFNFEISYKNIVLNADFQGQSGNEIYNLKETVRPDLYNFEQHVYDRWTPSNPSTTEPRATAGGYNFLPSSRFIQSGSFFRLRSITIGYDFPSSLTEKISMQSARLYLRGTNVFTVTEFTGYSPEVGSGSVIENGIDRSTYPVSTIYSVGLNITL